MHFIIIIFFVPFFTKNMYRIFLTLHDYLKLWNNSPNLSYITWIFLHDILFHGFLRDASIV